MQKIKGILKSILKKDGFIYKLLRRSYHCLSTIKYKIINRKEIKKNNKVFSRRAKEAIEMIDKYKSEEYIVFYNPTWLGVAASTMGLFKNNIPLEHIHKKRLIKLIAIKIKECNIKSVIFSQICDGWIEEIEMLKKVNPDIKVKVIWHGNCYEYFSDFTWNLNKKVMELCNKEKIDCLAFVRSTMYEFYKSIGFKSFYLQNNVYKENEGKTSNNKNNKIKIGIYNADSRELKNIYTALSAIKLVGNSVADVVPINQGAKRFSEILGLEIESLNNYISNVELMERVQHNDINIYPTYTENAPMFPLESFEMGVPCLLGNNNDYFVDTELGKYVILDREDDAVYIKERIQNALKNRDLIMQLYREWKNEFNKKCDNLVNEFIKA